MAGIGVRGGGCSPPFFGQFGTENSGKSALDSGNFYKLFARKYGKNGPKLLQNTAFFSGAPRPYLTFYLRERGQTFCAKNIITF
jgi:hypothetical protein